MGIFRYNNNNNITQPSMLFCSFPKVPMLCYLVYGQFPLRNLPFFFMLITMPSWIEITLWAFAAIGFLNTLRDLIINYAPNTRIGKWLLTPPPPPTPNPDPKWREIMEKRLETTENILAELRRQNAFSQEPMQAVVTFSPRPRRSGLRNRANTSEDGSRGQAQ